MLKSSKGITLVALVITIIVLLILAGVTLNIVLHTGLMDKSQNAVDKYDDRAKNETAQLNWLNDEYQKLIDKYKKQPASPATGA